MEAAHLCRSAALSTSSSSNPQSRQSLTAAIKSNIGQFADRLTSFVDDRAVLPKDTSRPPPCATDFRKIVNSKLLVVDVTAAVRIIASADSAITPTSEVVTALRLKTLCYLSTCVNHQQSRYLKRRLLLRKKQWSP